MANIEPVQIVEIDIDYCTLSYGTGACTAVLGTTGVRKCFNTFATCQAKAAFNKGTKTIRFITPTASVPKGNTVYFPALTSVSAFSTSVNINGFNPKYGALGKRAKVTVNLKDFAYHDRYMDKYQSERVDGTAQTDEGGYDPATRGSFFTKFKSRFPFYSGRPMRVIDGYVDNGVFTTLQTRHFIITEMKGPNDNGNVTIEAKDVLTLAEKKSAIAPKISSGDISRDLLIADSTTVLTPAGIGSNYPTSGYARIGDEIVAYTRSGDDITLTLRGLYNTEVQDHKEGDTFQEVIVYENAAINEVLEDLLTNYTDIDPSYFPTTDWADEIARWNSTLDLNAVIAEPTAVAELIGELAILGVSIWWDDVDQKIKLKAAKPIDPDTVVLAIDDDKNIKSITQEDQDQDRITQLHFYTVQSNPTEGVKDKGNYDRITITIDAEAEQENSYNDTRIKEIFCRWLNAGADAAVRIRSQRYLFRFNTSPKLFKIKLDAKDIDIGLADVLDVSSRVITDETGKPIPTKLEIIQKSEPTAGHEVDLIAQAYYYEGKFGYIMLNTANGYDTATDDEKAYGCYLADEAGVVFTDDPYVII